MLMNINLHFCCFAMTFFRFIMLPFAEEKKYQNDINTGSFTEYVSAATEHAPNAPYPGAIPVSTFASCWCFLPLSVSLLKTLNSSEVIDAAAATCSRPVNDCSAVLFRSGFHWLYSYFSATRVRVVLCTRHKELSVILLQLTLQKCISKQSPVHGKEHDGLGCFHPIFNLAGLCRKII